MVCSGGSGRSLRCFAILLRGTAFRVGCTRLGRTLVGCVPRWALSVERVLRRCATGCARVFFCRTPPGRTVCGPSQRSLVPLRAVAVPRVPFRHSRVRLVVQGRVPWPPLGDPSHEPCRWCDPPECAPFPLRPVLLGRILLGRVSVGRVPVGFVGVRPLALRRGPLRCVPVREVPTRTARSPSATRRSAIAVRQKAAAGFEPASILSPSPLLRPLS